MCKPETPTPAPPSAGPGASTPACGPTPCPAAPPTLEIVDRKTGRVVSGTTVDKIVGQKIELAVRSKPSGHAVTNIRWTVPAQTVKNYTQSANAGTRTDLAAADLQGTNLDFYWIDGGSKTVQVTADVDGAAQSSSVTHNVLTPTNPSMTSTTGTVAVGNPGFPGSGLELHFGTRATPGIRWTLTATAPAGGAGQIAGTQLVETVRTITPNGGTARTLTSAGAFVLDTTVPYAAPVAIAASTAATWTASDTPGNGLTPGLQQVTVADNFRIYFMYRPAGADSIWVTLMRLDWHWAGATTRVGAPGGAGNNWNPPSGVSNSTNPSGSASTELPTWTANVTSLNFSP